MNNLFLAVYPPADEAVPIVQAASRLDSEHQLDGDPVKHLHVTLAALNTVREPPQTIIDKVTAAAATIDMAAFDVAFDRAVSFSGRIRNRPLVLLGGDGVAGLVALQRSLIRVLHKQWLKIPADPGYTPHMTLLYADRQLSEQSIPALRWRVREFALVDSLVGRGEHKILARWPLRSDAG
jgi:2'-5' RNA ligase